LTGSTSRSPIFALLGPNGAGKTTIVQILSTLIAADAGDVRVAGHDLAHDPEAVRAAIGVTGQFAAVDNLLTGEENLILMTDLHRLGRAEGRRRAAELLARFDLVEAARRPAQRCARRRVVRRPDGGGLRLGAQGVRSPADALTHRFSANS
jgi:ABC-2 type transport system ATP-binding protein